MSDSTQQQTPDAPSNRSPAASSSPGSQTAAGNPAAGNQPKAGLERAQRSAPLARPEQDWPFSFVQRFMRDMDRAFEDFGFGGSGLSPLFQTDLATPGAWAPRLDISRREGQLMVHVDLPGLRQEDIHVNVEKGLLSISGERNDEHQSNERGVYRRERSYGSFRRNIALPDNVDPAGIKANFQNGVLEISVALPKEDRPQSRSIPVQSESSPPELKH